MAGNVKRTVTVDGVGQVTYQVPASATPEMERRALAAALAKRNDFAGSVATGLRQASASAPTIQEAVRHLNGTRPAPVSLKRAVPNALLPHARTREEVWRGRGVGAGSITAPEIGPTDLAVDAVSNLVGKTGLDPRIARNIGKDVVDFAQISPLGVVEPGFQAGKALRESRPGSALANFALGGIDAFSGGVGGAVAGKVASVAAPALKAGLAKGGSALSMFLGPPTSIC